MENFGRNYVILELADPDYFSPLTLLDNSTTSQAITI